MIDRRYPHLCRLSDAARVPAHERPRIQRLLDSIKSRTNWVGLYDQLGHRLFFYLGDIRIGAALPWEWTDLAEPHKLDNLWAERVVKAFQEAKAKSWADRDRDEQYAETSKASDEQIASNRRKQDLVPTAKGLVKRQNNRLGMSSKYRPSALVNGLKQEVAA